jgi:hypothetical protein
VADLSASEGFTADDLATSTEMISKILVPLMGDKVAYPVCEKKEAHCFFMTLEDLDKHLSLHHLEIPILWECTYCGRTFPKLHGERCHTLKCNGPK